MNVLLTGEPGVGKTTLIVRILGVIQNLRAAGFYTREIRQGSIRKGAGIIGQIKRRPDIRLFEMTRDNRDSLVKDISKLLNP
jgi:nucleoside-triphosphatase THEP1